MLIKRLFSRLLSCVYILPPETQEPEPVSQPEIQPANNPEPANPVENELVNQPDPEPETEEAAEQAAVSELAAAAEPANEDEPEADYDDELDMLIAAMKERGKRRGRLETIPEEPEAEARALFEEADELAAVAADLAAAAMVPPKRPEAKDLVKKMKRKIKKIFVSGGIKEENAELDKIREDAFTFMPM